MLNGYKAWENININVNDSIIDFALASRSTNATISSPSAETDNVDAVTTKSLDVNLRSKMINIIRCWKKRH